MVHKTSTHRVSSFLIIFGHVIHSDSESKAQKTDFILKRVHRHQPSPEEFTAYLEENRVRHGVPTAVDRWISAGLTSAPPRACSAQENRVPTQQSSPIFFSDLVECQLTTTQTEVRS